MKRLISSAILAALLALSSTAWSQLAVDPQRPILASPQGSEEKIAGSLVYANYRVTSQLGAQEHPRMAVSNNRLYLVWTDDRDGNKEIYWEMLDWLGSSIAGPVRVSNTSASSDNPVIGVDAVGNSYVAWLENPPFGDVYAAVINSSGTISFAPRAVSPGLSANPDIAVTSSGQSWVTFERKAATDQDVYLRRLNNSLGQVCEQRFNLGTYPADNKTPVVTATNETDAVPAWWDLTTQWQQGIFVKRTDPDCAILPVDRFFPDLKCPDIAWSGAWPWSAAFTNGNVFNLYYDNSVARINDVDGTAHCPARLGDDQNQGYAVWSDNRDGNDEIYLSRFYADQTFADVRLTCNASSSLYPDIACYNPSPGKWWAVWQDNRNGSWDIYLTGYNWLCGDVDDDGSVNIADVVFLLEYIFSDGAAPNPLATGDANSDNDVNIADCVYLINYIFSGGPAPCAGC